jgi:hypothetical protein
VKEAAMTDMTSISEVAQFPVLDREEAQTFLQYLDPDTDAFTFQTFTDSDEKREAFEINPRTKKPIDPLARTLHGTLDQHWTTLANLSRNGAGIFVTINRTMLQGRRTAENIVAVRAYFADFDEVDPETFKTNLSLIGLTPHLITQSSEGKWHVYWFVDGASLAEFGRTQEMLIKVMGSDATVKDLPRVMRLPGFSHQKDAAKLSLVKIVHNYEGDNYTNADFQRALTKAFAAREPRRSVSDAVIGGLPKPPPDWSQGYSEGQRNNECAKRAGSCFARGMSEEEALAECLRWNEKNNPPLPDNEVKATVASIATRHARNQIANPTVSASNQLHPDSGQFVFDGDVIASPPKMLLKKLLPASGVAFIGGQSGAGKTFIAVALGVALASGTAFFKYQVKERIGVAYIAAEGQDMFPARVGAAKLASGVKGPIPFAWLDTIPALQTQQEVTEFIEALRGLTKEMQLRFGVRLGAIFIDTVAACLPMKDENSNAEVSGVCRIMRYIGQSIGAVVIPIHHYGKDAGTGLRGASAWHGTADVVVSVTCDIDPQSGRVGNRGLAMAKARDAEQGQITPFILEWVKLGADDEGDDFGSCIVKADPERLCQNVARNKAPKSIQAFDAACRMALGESSVDIQLKKSGSQTRAVELKHVKAKFRTLYVTGSGDPKKATGAADKAFLRALEKLPIEYSTARSDDGREWLSLKA